jgi:GAF domain-containing protein
MAMIDGFDSKRGSLAADAVLDLCQPFLATLPISGVSVTVISSSGSESTLCSSDEVAARVDELQFELGEGPQWAASSTGEIVVIDDVAAGPHPLWPIFAAAVGELPVGAIFSIPMKMGAVTVGVATLYRDRAGDLSKDQQISAMAIASAIASTAVQRAMVSASDDAAPESAAIPALRREVHQATGMILAQLETSATIAYSRLQAYAFLNGRTVQKVAHDVVTRKLTFDDLIS